MCVRPKFIPYRGIPQGVSLSSQVRAAIDLVCIIYNSSSRKMGDLTPHFMWLVWV